MDIVFKELSAQENATLIDAIPMITLLIGSADGLLDKNEKEWAERVIKFRTFSHDEELKHYYEAVSRTFDGHLTALLKETRGGGERRKTYLTEKLSELNPILNKLGGHESYRLYQDLLSFAKHVAKSSGGILYMATISPEEKALLGLDMITPINSYPGL